ncbi:MAG TPA: hypothetical protein VFO81_08070, partial [Gaiellaceae bacterium]|nr:hypothetical protein [Gaiellaceae bacterium]
QTEEQLPRDAKVPPGSLRALDGVERGREDVLAAVLHRLDRLYAAWRDVGLAAVHAHLGERDYLRGRRVRTDAGPGVAAGIDDAGRLLVRTDGGTVAVASGEIDLVP